MAAKTWEQHKAECEAVAKPGITILGYVGEWKGAKTKLKCLCDKHGEWCSTGIDMFKQGRSCPGCAVDLLRERSSKTWEEYFPSIKAIADTKGYTIKGCGEWRGCRTKLKLVCPLHGEFNKTNIDNFLAGQGCPACGLEKIRKSRSLSDDTHVKGFMSTGKFKEGTTFKRNTHKVDFKGAYSYWDYTCPVCSDDEYVKAGVCNGVFTSHRSNLKKGHIACRCSVGYRYTKPQWEYRLAKECKSRGYVFIGWKGKGWGSNAKFTYKCPLHGEQSTIVDHFLVGQGCPSCGRQLVEGSWRKSDADHIEDFMKTGVFPEGTLFTKGEKKGNNQHWNVFCPICASDEYASNGLCDGVFSAFEGSLKAGSKACRCSKTRRFTEEQWRWRVSKECERIGYVFKDFLPGKPNNNRKFTYLCPTHGEQTMKINNLFVGGGCPECKGKNQRQGYINAVLDGDVPIAIKIGITKNLNKRLSIQNKKNKFTMSTVGLYEFPTIKQCKDAENECKQVLKCRVVSKQDMPDGWTETVALTDYDKVVSIYERFGGVRVDTLIEEEV